MFYALKSLLIILKVNITLYLIKPLIYGNIYLKILARYHMNNVLLVLLLILIFSLYIYTLVQVKFSYEKHNIIKLLQLLIFTILILSYFKASIKLLIIALILIILLIIIPKKFFK